AGVSWDEGHKRIGRVMREHYGDAYQPEEPRRSNGSAERETDSPYAALNDAAMKNLKAWVPELATGKSTPGIYGLRRKVGRYDAFVGVAAWRVGTDGPPIEQWDCNLKIVSSGITDWASGEKFTPINLVMKARAYEFDEAVRWLEERVVGPDTT